jgi:hypothetical protein
MPFTITPVEGLIKRGVVYAYKRDRGHRPVVIINVERLLETMVSACNKYRTVGRARSGSISSKLSNRLHH